MLVVFIVGSCSSILNIIKSEICLYSNYITESLTNVFYGGSSLMAELSAVARMDWVQFPATAFYKRQTINTTLNQR